MGSMFSLLPPDMAAGRIEKQIELVRARYGGMQWEEQSRTTLHGMVRNMPAAALGRQNKHGETLFMQLTRVARSNENHLREALERAPDEAARRAVLLQPAANGQTVLHAAVSRSVEGTVMDLAVENNCAAELLLATSENEGFTPVHLACSSRPGSVQGLMRFAEPLPDPTGNTRSLATHLMLLPSTLEQWLPLHLMCRSMGLTSADLEPFLNITVPVDIRIAQLTTRATSGYTAFLYACRYPQQADALRYLLRTADELGIMREVLSAVDDEGRTAAKVICRWGRGGTGDPLRVVLEAVQPYPELRDLILNPRDEPLIVTVARYDKIEALTTLINFDVDIDAPGLGGLTALHVASQQSYVRSVSALLNFGADAVLCDDEGHTPLHYATNVDVRRLLEQSEEAAAERLPIKSAAKLT